MILLVLIMLHCCLLLRRSVLIADGVAVVVDPTSGADVGFALLPLHRY
jgi:hypothetical protein